MTGQDISRPWLQHYPRDVQWDSTIEPQPLFTILEDTARRFPQTTALDFLGKTWSYKSLARLVDHAAEGLRGLGVRKGTKVALFLPNCPQFVISFYAILKVGAVVVPCSPLYSRKQLAHQIEDAEVEIAITLNLKELYPNIAPLIGQGRFRHIIVSDLPWALPMIPATLFPLLRRKTIAKIPRDTHHTRWHELLHNNGVRRSASIHPDTDIAALQYTGGTTGTPKGAMLTHKNLHMNAWQTALWSQLAGADGTVKVLCALPFFHIFALTTLMNRSIMTGATMILHPRFELQKVLKDIERKKPQLMCAVPAMLIAINRSPELDNYDLTSLRACISGGAPLPIEVKKNFEDKTGSTVVEGYGLTEASPVVCANPLSGINKPGSIGVPLPNTDVAIEDMEQPGKWLTTPDQRGELCTRGPQVMLGYWKHDQATAEVTTPDGWLRTGDIATIDEQGYVFIVDRRKEMIICNGFNVYPRTVEDAIYTHPDVEETAVVGMPHHETGELIKAAIVLKDGSSLNKQDLHTYLKEILGRHELPQEIEFKESLPKTMIGKIDKKLIKESIMNDIVVENEN